MLDDYSHHSLSSTISIAAPIQKCCGKNAPQADPKKKSVRFDVSRNAYFCHTTDNNNFHSDTWYTAQDYEQFRKTTRDAVMDFRETMATEQHKKAFATTLKALCKRLDRLEWVVEGDVMTFLPPHMVDNMARFYQQDSLLSFLGLETYVVCGMRNHITQRREQIRKVVFDIQAEYVDGLFSANEVDQEFLDSCLTYSQSSTLFAQLLAKIQWDAAAALDA